MSNYLRKDRLPKTWVLTYIEEVCTTPQYGYTTKASKEGNVKLLRTTDITKGKIDWMSVPYCYENPSDIDKYLLKEGDIVISRAGSVGVSYLIEDPDYSVFASYLIRFNPITNKKFFKHYLDSPYYWESISEGKLGIALPNINASKLKAIKFPLPPSKEQYRIVQKIESLFSGIEKGEEHLKNAQYQLKLYRESLLQKAFSGQLTQQWREEHQLESIDQILEALATQRQKSYEEQLSNWQDSVSKWEQDGKIGRRPTKPRALKSYSLFTKEEINNLPELPDTWSWIKLGQISEIVGGVTKGRKLVGKKTVKVPYLRVANVQDGYLDLSEVKEIEVLPEDITKYQLEAGDVLYIEGGDKDKLGRGTIWNNELPKCIHQNHVFRARMINRMLNVPEFIAYNSQTQVAKGYFFNNAKQTVNLASINMTVLSELPIPICSNEEQREILIRLDNIFSKQKELDKIITSALNDAQVLRQSILKKAFEGKLVPQDSNDELASELLIKIQEEKLQWQKLQKATRKISKPKKRMELLSIEEVLKRAEKPITPKQLWENSKHKHDIEEFYLELKKLGDKVVEIKNETESLLRLENAN